MDRSEYIMVVNDKYLNKQFDYVLEQHTRYYYDLNKSGYAQGLNPNVKVYQTNPNEFNKEQLIIKWMYK